MEVRVITGPCAGKTTFIPRITISPSEEELPFELHRRQFPVCLAFAMTINKAEGQSLDMGSFMLVFQGELVGGE